MTRSNSDSNLIDRVHVELHERGARMGRRLHQSEHSRGGHRRGGSGHRRRARRGALRLSVLTLLNERPMHGYELITELETRSEGRWRPSAGSIYPTLNRLDEGGLVTSTEMEGKRQFSLTDRGREVLGELRDAQGDDAPAPWDDRGTGGRGDLRRHVSELVSQARQIGRFGTAEQIERTETILVDTIQNLYAVLASPTINPEPELDAETAPGAEPGPAEPLEPQ
jgi:DNA-binding PadR family transcriptional regulator